MSRQVNAGDPSSGFPSEKDFREKGQIATADLTIADTVDPTKQIIFDGSAMATNTTLTIKAGAQGANAVITLPSSTSTLVSSANDLTWNKYTTSHTALQTAGTTNNITLFSLPAKTIIHQIVTKTTVAFAGTSISAYTISVGITGTLAKYSPAFDVLQAVSSSVFQTSSSGNMEDFSGATNIKIAAISTGANLSVSSAGSVDVYVLTSTLP